MDTQTKRLPCCICEELVDPPYPMLGGRVYCQRHYAVVNKPHAGFWRATVVEVLGVGLICGLIALIASYLPPLQGSARLLAGLVIALVPPALWMAFFYRQDRLEPEPKHMVAQVFLLAMVLTELFISLVVRGWLQLSEWAVNDTLTNLLASILVYGVLYQAIAYFSVRYTAYPTPEFDERMDGIVYGTIAGLGIATLTNLRYILENGGVDLGFGAIRVATTTLALASFAGLQGYFMAGAKFERRPGWYLPLGFVFASLFNGLFSWLINEVSAAGLTVNPWNSLLLGMLIAALVFGGLVWAMGRFTRATLDPTASSSS